MLDQWLNFKATTLPPPLLVLGKRSIGKTRIILGMLETNPKLNCCQMGSAAYEPTKKLSTDLGPDAGKIIPRLPYQDGYIYEAEVLPADYKGSVFKLEIFNIDCCCNSQQLLVSGCQCGGT